MTGSEDRDMRPAGGGSPGDDRTHTLPEATADHSVLDWELAVEQMEGREDLLQQLAQTFDAECRALMNGIAQAISAGDPKRLRRSAHTLKGSACIFCARATENAARRLELLADSESRDAIQEAWSNLQRAVVQLMPALAARAGPSG